MNNPDCFRFGSRGVIRIFACLVVPLWFGVLVGRADTHYVSLVGGNASPYTNGWAGAATNIQSAVDASDDGDTVLVTNGTYAAGGAVTPGHTLANRVCIYGKTITLRSVNGPEVTIIKGKPDDVTGACGSNAVRCVYLAACPGPTLIGFTLTNGHTRTSGHEKYDLSGGGIFINYYYAAISNCVVTGNKAHYCGGGILNSRGTVDHCAIIGNSAGHYGGGIALYPSDIGGWFINNCVLANNSAGAYGGGVWFNRFNSAMNNCALTANWAAQYGGGVMFQTGDGVMNNCLLIGNVTTNLGGNAYFNKCGTMNNCTLTAGGGGGVRMDTGGALTNCIVWGNSNWDFYIHITGTVSHTCSNPRQSGEGNIGNIPLFVDTNSGNYRLTSGSPCVNAGTNQAWMTNAVDLDGQPRIRCGTVDLGAYETISESTNGIAH